MFDLNASHINGFTGIVMHTRGSPHSVKSENHAKVICTCMTMPEHLNTVITVYIHYSTVTCYCKYST